MLTYSPAPDTSDLSSHQRASLCRKLNLVRHDLRAVTQADPYTTPELSTLGAFMDTVLMSTDYDGIRLALDMWERLPTERREWVKRRREELYTPAEIAAREDDRALQYRVEHPYQADPVPADAKPRVRRRIEQGNERMAAQNKAYRIELRRRRNPHLRLVWVNDGPRDRPDAMMDSLREAHGRLANLLGRLGDRDHAD
jgi:hypothetical protein